jgi:hypothetical protein
MIPRFTILIAACVFLAGVALGEDVAVQTANHKSLDLHEFRVAYFPEIPDSQEVATSTDSAGNPRYQMLKWPKAVEAGDTIPLKVGHGFGFDFKCPQVADGDELVLDVEIQIPPKKRVITTQYRYDLPQSGQYSFILWGFRKDHPEYHILGTWRIRILNQGKEVYSHDFHVVKEQPAKNAVKPTSAH